jgi:hypothetical protein
MKACQKCSEEWTRKEQPGFKATCPKCQAYLHSCRNCRLYNPSADRCSSVTAECAGDRESLNYCEEFMFRDAPANGGRRNGNGHGAATVLGLNVRAPRAVSETPIRRPSSPPSRPGGSGRDKFDKLFNE